MGFGVALMGLFTDASYGFPNLKEAFFTLFSSGLGETFTSLLVMILLGNFDVSGYHGPYKDVGRVLLVVYVIFVLVLLLNLLIARMAVHLKTYPLL